MIADGKTAIDAAATIDEINSAKQNALDAIAAVKTDAQLTAEELAAAKVAAKAELDELYNSIDKSKYSEDNQAELLRLYNEAKAAIDNCATIEALNELVSNAKSAINAVEQQPEKKRTEEEKEFRI